MNETRMKQVFLAGTVLLFVLIIGGLIWAIAAGPSPETPSGRGVAESGLHFADDNDPAIGAGESKVTVRMYSDLQCPACRNAEPGLQAAMEKYKDRVRFVWIDFPLVTIHANAMAAANAARCAEEQGKFWDYRKKLFETQDVWAGLAAPTTHFVETARSVGADDNVFSACVANKTYEHKIRDDMSEGLSNRVNSTPTFFVNNVRYSGGLTASDWDDILTKALSGS